MAKLDQQEKLENQNVIVSDIEARDWINFLCIGVYDGKIYKYFISLEDYFDFIFSCKCKEIYFHFGGGYDFLFLLDFSYKNFETFEVTEMLPRGSKFLSISIKRKSTGHVIRFMDSSALLPFSLRSLAENFGVETQKGEIDYEKILEVTDELLFYMKADHLALHQVLIKFFSNPLIVAAGRKQTIASQAYNIYKKSFQKVAIDRLSPEIDSFCRQAYQGGRTEIFKPVFNGPGKLSVYDINSLYPFAMKNSDYPISFKNWTRSFKENELGIYHLTVFVPLMDIPPLGVINKGKYVFPCGKFEGYWTNVEINMAKKFGVKIIKVHKGAIFENGGKIFKDYVDEIYNLRKKSNPNSADNVIYKLLLNSLYGRFALNLERQKIVADDGRQGLKPMMKINVGKNKFVSLAYEDVTLKSDTFSPISIFVTSYARIYNYENYLSKYDVYYHDTDSFFIKDIVPTSNDLGDIKLEYQIDQACFLLPKTYIGMSSEKTVLKMKGFDKKKLKNFQFDDFMAALEGDLKRLKSKTPRRIAKFRESIKRNKKILSILEESDKNIRSQYDKRIFYKNKKGQYFSKPLILNSEN